jgi:hypothetical protein
MAFNDVRIYCNLVYTAKLILTGTENNYGIHAKYTDIYLLYLPVPSNVEGYNVNKKPFQPFEVKFKSKSLCNWSVLVSSLFLGLVTRFSVVGLIVT